MATKSRVTSYREIIADLLWWSTLEHSTPRDGLTEAELAAFREMVSDKLRYANLPPIEATVV